jgi:hypothetical protein
MVAAANALDEALDTAIGSPDSQNEDSEDTTPDGERA